MVIAFYKGKTRVFNKVTSWWLKGDYSHCELILGYDETGQAICASSSMMDGGVRVKHMRLDPEHWDLVEVEGDLDFAWKWLKDHEGEKYDYLGLAGLAARVIGQDAIRFVCSEAVAEMLGIKDAWRFDPCSLHAAVSKRYI